MFDIPGFIPSSMSDDELLNRQAELSRRLNWANRFSGSGDMATQLWSMISAIEAERRDRVLKIMFDNRQKIFPEVIETEPDMVNKKKIATDDKDQKMVNRRKIGRERLTLTKTSTPPQMQPHFPQHDRLPPQDDEDSKG